MDIEIDKLLKKLPKNMQSDKEFVSYFTSTFNLQKNMVDTVQTLGKSKIDTPIPYVIMGFVEIFDSLLNSNPAIQMDILKGVKKFVELIPPGEDDLGQKITIQLMDTFIKFAGNIGD